MKRGKKLLTGFCALAIVMILLYLLIPDKSAKLNNFGKVVYDRNGKMIRAFLNSDEQWCLSPFSQEIPHKLKTSVLMFEDRYFYYHPGFNAVAIFKALIRNIEAGHVVSGGSTITMQVCRIAEPGRRTLLKKLAETLQAIKLEIKYSKNTILRFYLDNAPYGRNIKGVRAASLKYFQRELADLSWAESALLAVLPNEPSKLNPEKGSMQLKEKRNRLLISLAEKGIISEEILQSSLLEPLPEKCYNLPQRAMHLSRIAEQSSSNSEIYSTIDLEIQSIVEKKADLYSDKLANVGITNCSALVADNSTGEILAWLGSNDFFNDMHQGEVDGVLAKRSPGSTLKPFLYALSIDEGLIIPQTLLYDVPSYYGSYSPENSSGKYDGWVRADHALIRSLNVPAVRLLNRFGYKNYYHWLKTAGLSTLFRDAEDYGLTLVLGGCEVKMIELAGLYMTLANYGSFKPLVFLQNQKKVTEKQLISPGSCWQVLNILSELARPGNEYYWHQFENQWQLAWKTGTSYGNRDAWAIGINPQYTIAVWAGNFDSESNSELMGASAAAPLLFSIFNNLPKDLHRNWFEMPENEMTMREVCSQTGLAPSEFCEKDTVFIPKDAELLRKCNYHQPFQVTDDGKNTVCSKCWQGHPHHTEVFLVYPPQVKKWQNMNGYICPDIPPHLPSCPTKSMNNLSIIYPVEGGVLFLPRDLDGELQKLSPRISVNSEETKLFWYLDDEFLGISNGRENFPLAPDSGEHTLSIIDATGNKASCSFEIRLSENN